MGYYPPVLPGGPSYESGEDPKREKRLEQLNQDYAESPWLTLLVKFSGFLLVFLGSFIAVILLINLDSSAWWPYALILAVLVAAHVGLRMLRHQRRAAG